MIKGQETTDHTDHGFTPRNNNSYTVSDVKPGYVDQQAGMQRNMSGYNNMMAGLGPGPFYPMGPMDHQPIYQGGYEQFDYYHPPHCELEAHPHYPRMSPYFPQSYYPFYQHSTVHGYPYPRPTERRISYYPFIRYGTDYEQRVIRVPVEKTRTKYEERVFEISYIPKAIEETVMETRPVERVTKKIEYVPVQRKIIHMPKDQKKASIVNPEKHPDLMEYLKENEQRGGTIRREGNTTITNQQQQFRRSTTHQNNGVTITNTQYAVPVNNRRPPSRPFDNLNQQSNVDQNSNTLNTNFKESHVRQLYDSRRERQANN